VCQTQMVSALTHALPRLLFFCRESSPFPPPFFSSLPFFFSLLWAVEEHLSARSAKNKSSITVRVFFPPFPSPFFFLIFGPPRLVGHPPRMTEGIYARLLGLPPPPPPPPPPLRNYLRVTSRRTGVQGFVPGTTCPPPPPPFFSSPVLPSSACRYTADTEFIKQRLTRPNSAPSCPLVTPFSLFSFFPPLLFEKGVVRLNPEHV